MVKIKNHDFVEIDYIGKVKSTNQIFDLTNEEVAKKNNIQSEREYKPIIICIGERNILKGIDDNLLDKDIGKEYEFTIKPEDAFGKRNPKLMKLVSVNVFKKSNLMPVPGLQINIDGALGTIRSFSGGRVIVDFNHPLADKELVYSVKILREVKDPKEKLTACMKFMSLNDDSFTIEINKDETIIKLKANLDKTLKEMLEKKILDLVPEVKKIKIELDTKKDIKK